MRDAIHAPAPLIAGNEDWENWRKGTDTMDVWFDSGSSWASVVQQRDALRSFWTDAAPCPSELADDTPRQAVQVRDPVAHLLRHPKLQDDPLVDEADAAAVDLDAALVEVELDLDAAVPRAILCGRGVGAHWVCLGSGATIVDVEGTATDE